MGEGGSPPRLSEMPRMSAPLTAPAVLDRVFLEVRAKLLEVAASLDRIERSDDAETLRRDYRLQQIRETISILNSPGSDRAERVQMIFSDPYVSNWMKK